MATCALLMCSAGWTEVCFSRSVSSGNHAHIIYSFNSTRLATKDCCCQWQHVGPIIWLPSCCSYAREGKLSPVLRTQDTEGIWGCAHSTRSQWVFGPAASLLSDTTAWGPSESLARQLPCCQTLQHEVPVSLALQLTCCQTLQHQVPVSLALQLTCCQTLQHQVPVNLALQLPWCQTLQHHVPISVWPCSFPAVRHYSTRSQSVWPCSFPAVRHYSTRSQSVFGPAAYLLSDTTAPGPSQSLALQLPCC